MGTVVRRNAPNGEVPRPLRPFVSSWKTVQCGLAAASREKVRGVAGFYGGIWYAKANILTKGSR